MTLSNAEMIEEIDSWGRFASRLRAEDRTLFREMLSLTYEYFPAMYGKDSPLASEALFMCLLLAQHKAIATLTSEIDMIKVKMKARPDT